MYRTYTGGEAPPIRTIQNTQAPPEFFSKFLTLPQIISTSLAKQKGNILYKNCTRIAKVTYYKNCTVQFLSRRYFVQFLCYVTYFSHVMEVHGYSTKKPRPIPRTDVRMNFSKFVRRVGVDPCEKTNPGARHLSVVKTSAPCDVRQSKKC